MEQKVIARKKALVAVYMLPLVIGIVMAACGGVLLALCLREGREIVAAVFLIVLGAVLIAASVVVLVQICRLPEVIAVREGDELVFLGERCRLCEIARVEYRRAHMRYGTYAWGKLMVAVRDGREISCNYVADVEQAHNRLIDLMREYAAKEAE